MYETEALSKKKCARSAAREGFTASSEALPTWGRPLTLNPRQKIHTNFNIKYPHTNFKIKLSTLKPTYFFSEESPKRQKLDPQNKSQNKKTLKTERDSRYTLNPR
ncbi:unnamed protein product [Laminaria digitata]